MGAGGVGQYLQSLSSVAWERSATVPKTEREALRQVAGEFEALFVAELLKSMRSTTLESGFLSQDRASKMYRDMHDEALAGKLSQTGSLGIGRMLEEELARGSRIR
jgi:flagellar protein FlgJ